MSGNHEPPDLDRAHALMMAALDDECSPEDRGELDRYLARNPELAVEWDRLRRLKEVTMTMAVRQPPDEVWDRYRVTPLRRAERVVGWLLVTLGGAILGGWGVWHWLEDFLAADAPIVIKGAVVAVIIGGLALLGSVVRERWFMHRRDPYSREVVR